MIAHNYIMSTRAGGFAARCPGVSPDTHSRLAMPRGYSLHEVSAIQ